MARTRDVPMMMARVRSTLAAAERASGGASGVLKIEAEGDAEIDIPHLRHMADIDVVFQSGSDRPVVGPVIRYAKRAVRRVLHWYVAPMMAQQSEFNHSTLDAIERLRLRAVVLSDEVERLRREEAEREASAERRAGT